MSARERGQRRAAGERYDGRWRDGKRHGTGTLTRKNGYSYTGDWDEGCRSGDGVEFDPTTNLRYEGRFANDRSTFDAMRLIARGVASVSATYDPNAIASCYRPSRSRSKDATPPQPTTRRSLTANRADLFSWNSPKRIPTTPRRARPSSRCRIFSRTAATPFRRARETTRGRVRFDDARSDPWIRDRTSSVRAIGRPEVRCLLFMAESRYPRSYRGRRQRGGDERVQSSSYSFF